MKRTWTDIQIQQMHDYYPIRSLDDMALMIGKTAKSVKSKATVLKLIKKIRFYKKTWTEKQDNILREKYLKRTANEMAKILGVTKSAVKNRLNHLNIKLPEELRENRKLTTSYKKGSVPLNKGIPQKDWMSKESIKKCKETTFKKGNLPHNTKQDGFVSKRSFTKSGKNYSYIRLAKGKWIPLHVHIYKTHNGKVPKDKIIIFKDNNSDNFNLSNLIAITREEHIERMRDSDSYIVFQMEMKDKSLRQELLKHPELIDLKRTQLKLKKVINEKIR
jgi:hypothetical protein